MYVFAVFCRTEAVLAYYNMMLLPTKSVSLCSLTTSKLSKTQPVNRMLPAERQYSAVTLFPYCIMWTYWKRSWLAFKFDFTPFHTLKVATWRCKERSVVLWSTTYTCKRWTCSLFNYGNFMLWLITFKFHPPPPIWFSKRHLHNASDCTFPFVDPKWREYYLSLFYCKTTLSSPISSDC
jgi:hypothetical protein